MWYSRGCSTSSGIRRSDKSSSSSSSSSGSGSGLDYRELGFIQGFGRRLYRNAGLRKTFRRVGNWSLCLKASMYTGFRLSELRLMYIYICIGLLGFSRLG